MRSPLAHRPPSCVLCLDVLCMFVHAALAIRHSMYTYLDVDVYGGALASRGHCRARPYLHSKRHVNPWMCLVTCVRTRGPCVAWLCRNTNKLIWSSTTKLPKLKLRARIQRDTLWLARNYLRDLSDIVDTERERDSFRGTWSPICDRAILRCRRAEVSSRPVAVPPHRR